MIKALTFILLWIVFVTSVFASDIPTQLHPLQQFEQLKQKGWRIYHFKGETEYSLSRTGESEVINAVSNASASSLIQQRTIKLKETPVLNWSWKTKNLIKTNNVYDEKSKDGDDFVLRIYVIVKGFFPWQTRSINYVWSAQHPVSSSWDNPYTDQVKMIVVESGSKNLNQWLKYERNIKADFKQYFDMDISKIQAIAIMTDTDNTGGYAESSFKDIRFLK